MEFSKRLLTPIKLIVFGVIYTLGYGFLTVLGLGPEPKGGTPVFLPPIFTWPLVLAALFLIRKLSERRYRIFFVIILLLHYVITALLVPQFMSGFVLSWREIWERNASFIVFTVLWYLTGQVLIWIPFLAQFFAQFKVGRLNRESR